jgi:mono/diheme cytochrome c family protein
MRRVQLLLLGGLLLLASCGPAYRGEPLYGPMTLSEPQEQLGQRVFDRRCHSCHPGGAGGLGPSLNDKPLPAGLIKFQVRHGLGVMPAFSEEEITDEELQALVRYMELLRAREPREE